MSEQQPEGLVLGPENDVAFGALMDTLVAAEADAAGAEGGAPAGAPAEGGGEAGAAGGAPADPAAPAGGAAPGVAADAGAAGSGDAGTAAAVPGGDGGATADAGGDAGGDGADASAGGGTAPAAWTADATQLSSEFGALTTKVEERFTEQFQQAALAEAREEYGNYFTALQKHPRLLVGTQVPALGRDGMETINSTDQAREWQEATKELLVEEIKDRAARAMEAQGTDLSTIHASIELFQKNVDLVPGTKQFDTELARRFTTLAQPYEKRGEDGKLQGYSIPVQALIDQLRTQLKSERAAASSPASPASAAGVAVPPTPAPAAAPAKPADPPQAAIPSKAGSSGGEKEDFSTLFGTIGLPNIQI